MKRFLLCFLFIVTLTGFKRAIAQANTEEILVGRLLICLQRQDNNLYLTLFPSFDTLYKMTQQYVDTSAAETKKLANLRSNPQKLQQFDPQYNPDMVTEFNEIIKKGADSGLHWKDMVMAKYELRKMILPKDLAGLTKIMPLRLEGYISVEDMLTRRRYVIAVRDICTVRDKWFGGRVINVLEAETIDEYIVKLAAENKAKKAKLWRQQNGIPEDTLAQTAESKTYTEDEEEEQDTKKRDVIERKYYIGMFDNETPVELYVRGLKGGCPEGVCSWQAMYRFLDMDEYIKLEVSRGPNGSWIFNEEPEVGAMELLLEGSRFTGTWMSLKDKTEYDVELDEKKEVKGRKLQEMDDVIENGMFAN